MNHLDETLQRNAEGYIGAREAAKIALEQGKLLVGTAVSLEVHAPSILLSSDSGRWEPILQNERGGSVPALRATSSADVAIWCGFGGDANVPLQRIVTPGARPILPESSAFDLGTFGWAAPRGYSQFRIHHDVPPFVEAWPDETAVGAIDIIDAPLVMHEHPEEPGNFFVYGSAQTIGSIVVRMGDVREIPFSTEFFRDRYSER